MLKYSFNKKWLCLVSQYGLSFKKEYTQLRLPNALNSTLQNGVLECKSSAGNYYMLKILPFLYKTSDNKFEFFYNSLTEDEYSNNKIILKVGKHIRHTLMKGISFCHRLSKILPKSHDFNIIMSVDEDYVTISFHLIRIGETWLVDDLEEYQLDAVLVMTVLQEIA